jgi:hypothetical protein
MIKKNTNTLADASMEADVEVNIEIIKYMPISLHKNTGENHYIKIANRSFENVGHVRYLGMTVTVQNLIREEIKRRLN